MCACACLPAYPVILGEDDNTNLTAAQRAQLVRLLKKAATALVKGQLHPHTAPLLAPQSDAMIGTSMHEAMIRTYMHVCVCVCARVYVCVWKALTPPLC
jgi:ribonuclease HII